MLIKKMPCRVKLKEIDVIKISLSTIIHDEWNEMLFMKDNLKYEHVWYQPSLCAI